MLFRKWFKVPFKQFVQDLKNETREDDISNGAATLAFYWLLALFPAMIFLLSLLPYLPIDNLHQTIMESFNQLLPEESAHMFSGTVAEVTSNQNGGLLSFGILGTIWAASNGMYAIMRQLNKTYDVKEERSFIKARSVALLMTFVFGVMIISAFSLIVFGGYLQNYLTKIFGYESLLVPLFGFLRWGVLLALLLLAFALMYYYGPNVEQEFRFITPGSVIGVSLFVLASLGFQYYVNNFADYAATYGGIGAVIVLMMWLYITGVIILLGSEVNALAEHYHAEGKDKGEKSMKTTSKLKFT